MAVQSNQITEEVVDDSEPPARKRKIEVSSNNTETGETVSVTRCKKNIRLYFYFKVSLLQCNYTFKYWVILIKYMYLLYDTLKKCYQM